MNVEVIKRLLIDKFDESIEGNLSRISAPEMNKHLRAAAVRKNIDLGPGKDLAEPYLRQKQIADSCIKDSRENIVVAHSQCDMLKVDPSDKSTWLFDLSKMVWWHMPTLYVQVGCRFGCCHLK